MAVKKFNPTTPSRRHMTVSTFEAVTKSKPEKRLTVSQKSLAGRNNTGRMTVRHRGGGHKQRYRLVDFNQTAKLNVPGVVTAVEYDPNRTAYIMLVTYKDGDKRYHLAPDGIKVGQEIIASEKAKINTGNRLQVRNIPVGYAIHNVELNPSKGGQLGRAAGNFIKLVSLDGPYAQIQLGSGEVRLIHKDCFASVGTISNLDHSNIVIGKAGRQRWKGRRPQVRGKAMNPCDHPHGGGEGGSPIGMVYPKTPWGMPALGKKTRNNKATDKMILKRRK